MLLYYITDRRQLSASEDEAKRLLLDRIAAAVKAGIDMIQIREKDLTARDLIDLGRRAAEIVRAAQQRTRLLINSRIDVAIACEADGVHLRSNDLSAADARSVLFQCGIRDATVAVSCHHPPEVDLAYGNGADCALFGAVFQKDRIANAAGLEHLRLACTSRGFPVFAIGGITVENAAACIRAGAAGVAGIRLFQHGNIADTALRLRAISVQH